MDFLTLALLAAVAAWLLKTKEQRSRIALLGQSLARYQIERKMELVTKGYLRALGEADPRRREHGWEDLRATEQELCSQFDRFAADFARNEEAVTRVSTLPLWLPFARVLLPGLCFDMREALAIHARGIRQAIEGAPPGSPKDRAFTILAELFLMQHTCHWFCKSRLVASARMLARHQTSYEQLLAAVQPQTCSDYELMVGRTKPVRP